MVIAKDSVEKQLLIHAMCHQKERQKSALQRLKYGLSDRERLAGYAVRWRT
jgi:hypothetical protein